MVVVHKASYRVPTTFGHSRTGQPIAAWYSIHCTDNDTIKNIKPAIDNKLHKTYLKTLNHHTNNNTINNTINTINNTINNTK